MGKITDQLQRQLYSDIYNRKYPIVKIESNPVFPSKIDEKVAQVICNENLV